LVHRFFLQEQENGKGDLVLVDDFLSGSLSFSVNGDKKED
jgi:hypothetical protein